MLTSNIQKLIEDYTDQKKSWDNPSTYQDDEYYNRCKFKSELMGDVIKDLQQLLDSNLQDTARDIVKSHSDQFMANLKDGYASYNKLDYIAYMMTLCELNDKPLEAQIRSIVESYIRVHG